MRLCGLAFALFVAARVAQGQGAPDSIALLGYEGIRRSLGPFIEEQVREKRLPGLAIAIVEDQRIVWARTFNASSPQDSAGTPLTLRSVYRVGSVSKLVTALAAMRLVEQRRLALDTAIRQYVPGFAAAEVTLRQLLSHRSGLPREPAAGHYFDSARVTLDATVSSLSRHQLVYPAGARTKYSNAGIAVVGRALELVAERPFASHVRDAVLQPLGMLDSRFDPDSQMQARVPEAEMWTLDGRRFAAPRFDLGMVPAGGLYSTLPDLARFISFVIAGGRSRTGEQLVRRATLDSMMTLQYDPAPTGFGIGFAVSQLDGHRRVGHNGGIYGFSTHLSILPDQRLGVVVAATADDVTAVISRIGTEALRAMLAQRSGSGHTPARTLPGDSALARALAGRYEARPRAGGRAPAFDLIARGDSLVVHRWQSARPDVLRRVTAVGIDTLVGDSRLAFGRRYQVRPRQIAADGDTLVRREMPRPPAPPPAEMVPLIGEYGPDFNVQYVFEQDGQLFLLVEWFDWYPLQRMSPDVYRLPDEGAYAGETVRFVRDSRRMVRAMLLGGVRFQRRAIGPRTGSQLRITPRVPPEQALRASRAASPPVDTGTGRAPDLVDLSTLERGIRLDIRYATTDNFLGIPFYASARALLQRPAAEALARVHRTLRSQGYGILVHDAYRPWFVTRAFWDATPDSLRWLVADPATGSRHNRGAAVDVTLYETLSGRVVEMPGTYDEATPRSLPDYPGGTARQRWHRELLRRAMEAEGFRVHPQEWWHFDYQDWRSYPILNTPFEEIR